jgi:hypothetical protein
MNVLTFINHKRDEELENYRPAEPDVEWHLVVEGNWSESMYHSGFFTYSIAQTREGYWVLNQCDRNGFLDGLTQEDVDEGRLNDDQLQAIWFTSLEEAQNERSDLICAVWLDPPAGLSAEEAGSRLYEEFLERGGKGVEE